MKILHIAAHLGGGIGKAHAAIARALPREVEQTFLLLEAPIDRRHAHTIARCGGRVIVERDPACIRAHALQADIVQLEYWGHPLLESVPFVFLPGIKTVCWCHVSGLFAPVMPAFPAFDRVVLTSDISLPAVKPAMRERTSVINSGFGFAGMRPHARASGRRPAITYLGTVDFKKLHRGIFDALDDATDDDLTPISLWGHINPEVAGCAAAMRRPERIALKGHTLDPAAALAEADIFFYPLRPDHYGTAENALVEAMSLGLVPVVLDNPAETQIVTHGESGLVARSIDECVAYLGRLARTPSLRADLAAGAVREAQTRSPVRSGNAFVALWKGLIAERNSMQVRQYA